MIKGAKEIEIEAKSKGLFGMEGAKGARVRVIIKRGKRPSKFKKE